MGKLTPEQRDALLARQRSAMDERRRLLDGGQGHDVAQPEKYSDAVGLDSDGRKLAVTREAEAADPRAEDTPPSRGSGLALD